MRPCCLAASSPATHQEVRGSRLASTGLSAVAFDRLVNESWHVLPAAVCPVLLIREWLSMFEPERFLFVSSERFANHPTAHVLDVLDFLGWGSATGSASARQQFASTPLGSDGNGSLLSNRTHRIEGREPMLDQTRVRLHNVACSCTHELRKLLRLKDGHDDFVVNGATDPNWCQRMDALMVNEAHLRPASSNFICPHWPKCPRSKQARLTSYHPMPRR